MITPPRKKPGKPAPRGNRYAYKPPEKRRVFVAGTLAPETVRKISELRTATGLTFGRLCDIAFSDFVAPAEIVARRKAEIVLAEKKAAEAAWRAKKSKNAL